MLRANGPAEALPPRRRSDVDTATARPDGADRASRPVVGAAVDLGSNSVHLLVAAIAGHRLEPLVDESVFLGLGGATAGGAPLGRAGRGELVATLVRYAGIAGRLGASTVTFVGTEPLRRAADAASIVHEVEAATRQPLHVLSHEEEALLTLIGVTEGRPVAHETLVVDIGGGSSEFARVTSRGSAHATGLRLGSAGLTETHVRHDPPTAGEIEAMRIAAREAMRAAPAAHPREIVAVGGTASNLAKILPAAATDRVLTRQRLDEALAVLGSEPAGLAAERHVLNPVRARILPAGATIVEAILDRYRLGEVRVSDASLREGAVLAVDHAGRAWRDRLPALARGWRV